MVNQSLQMPRPRTGPILVAVAAVLPFIVFWRLWTGNGWDRVFLDHDSTIVVYDFLVFLADSIQVYGEWPQWVWGIYSGMPFHTCLNNFSLYPGNLIFYLGLADPASSGVYNSYCLLHLSIGAVAFYRLALAIDARATLAFFGSLIYTFSGYNLFLLLEGLGWLIPHAWLPLAVLGVYRFVTTGCSAWMLTTALVAAMITTSMMPLIVIPTFLFLTLWFGYLTVKERPGASRRMTAIFFVSMLISLSLNAVQLIPVMEFSMTSVRNQISSYSYARDHYLILNAHRFLFDFFLGGDIALGHAGFIGGLLLLTGIWRQHGKWVDFWSSSFLLIAFGLLMSSDFFLYDLFYKVVPTFGRTTWAFRGVGSIYLLVAGFLVVAGIEAFWSPLRRQSWPADTVRFWMALIPTVAIVLFLLYRDAEIVRSLMPEGGANADVRSLFGQRFSAWIVTVFLALLLAVSLRSASNGKKIVIVLALLFVVDQMSVVQRCFVLRMQTASQILATQSILKQTRSPYLMERSQNPKIPSLGSARVNEYRNNVSMIQGPDNVGGSYPVLPRRQLQAFSAANFFDNYLYDGPQTGIDRKVRWPETRVQQIFDLEGSRAVGRIWLAPNYRLNPSRSTLKMLAEDDIDPARCLLLEDESKVLASEFGPVFAKFHGLLDRWTTPAARAVPPRDAQPLAAVSADWDLAAQTPNSAVFVYRGRPMKGAVFFSDSWYPGWNAYVDGMRVPLYVAEYAFKGLVLDAKPGTVVAFAFSPISTRIGAVLSAIALLVLLFLFCWPRLYRPLDGFSKESPS